MLAHAIVFQENNEIIYLKNYSTKDVLVPERNHDVSKKSWRHHPKWQNAANENLWNWKNFIVFEVGTVDRSFQIMSTTWCLTAVLILINCYLWCNMTMTIKVIITIAMIFCCIRYWFMEKIAPDSRWLWKIDLKMITNNDGSLKIRIKVILTILLILVLVDMWTRWL